MTINAHFDGKVIVPDVPVHLPVGQALRVVVELAASEAEGRPSVGGSHELPLWEGTVIGRLTRDEIYDAAN